MRIDSLASEVERLKKNKGLAAPFVNVDLREWIPAGATIRSAGAGDDGEGPSGALD